MNDAPSIAEWIGLMGSILFVAAIVAITLVGAARGSDLRAFEAMRAAAPGQFRNLVWVCRINCPLILIACPFGLGLGVSLMFDDNEGQLWFRILLALEMITACLALAWLSFRWVRWAWQVRL